jgi:serine/threonine-protein kinase HipA
MDSSGEWRLTPAYDVTFAVGRNYTARHQMRIRDKVAGFTRGDLLQVAQEFSIRDAAEILERAEDAVGSWPRYAARTGVAADSIKAVGRSLATRGAELASI